MHYVRRSGRLGEHYRGMKKPKHFNTFIYQPLQRTGHSPNDILEQPMEKFIYQINSSSRFKIKT